MGQSVDPEDPAYKKHQDVCEKLNMDATAANEAWKSYENIRETYTLEGDQLQWIGCALYAACRNTTTPTVGTSSVQGNCVSLTRLLTLCNLPLMEFFKKSKAWADMCNMPKNFSARIDTIQTNFSVSSLIFKKYQPIFLEMFKDPAEDLISRPPRSRRHRINPCRPSKLFDFGWSLFICIRSGISVISDDLVNSFHLLICVCDLLFSNALLANRKDLLNLDFNGLPETFTDENYSAESAPCIINLLCDKYGALSLEASVIKEISLKRYMSKLFQEKVLKGEPKNFSGLLESVNFETNLKAITKVYEQRMLKEGDFDERIFLAEWRRKMILSNSETQEGDVLNNSLSKGVESGLNIDSPNRILNDLNENTSKQEQYNTVNPLAPPTPLTGRKYLKAKDMSNACTAMKPTHNVIHLLQTLLVNCKDTPSENLVEIFKKSSSEIQDFVESKVQEMGNKFCEAYSKKNHEIDNSGQDFSKQRLQSAQKLFYKILEMVLNDEKAKKPNFDPQNLLQDQTFLLCLFSCCCEIVIYSYQNKDKSFPWILHTLELEAYYFYRVIEVIIKVALDHLSRDMVKHLNRIEETILESLAWKSSSPLWQVIEESGSKVPNYEDVALPGTFDFIDPNTPGLPVLRKKALDRGSQANDTPQSPISSASERFQSPIPSTGMVKKKLFLENKSTSILKGSQSIPQQNATSDRLPKVSDTSLSNNSNVMVTSTPSQPNTISRDQNKPRRTGSLALFFRKFYNLTFTRMQNLCSNLDIVDIELKRKIWTIYEYSIRERTVLMKDRHLDQILMSAVYVICKISKLEKYTFTEIMRCYRNQPQAESHIYRSVLISNNVDTNNTSSESGRNNQVNRTPPTPTDMAGTSRNYGSEVRGDLIKFYNTVYVPQVQQFATKSALGEGCTPNLTLSPLPKNRGIANSPVRRINESLMTSILDPKEINASPAPKFNYSFNRSPIKELHEINRMVTQYDARKFVRKRLLSDEILSTDSEEPPIKKITAQFVTRKLENIIDERRTQNQ